MKLTKIIWAIENQAPGRLLLLSSAVASYFFCYIIHSISPFIEENFLN